jgi:superfamily II DNA or RNA helicase
MASTTRNHKTVLLFSPQRLLTDHILLESLHIIRYEKQVDYVTSRLDALEIKEYYAHLPKQAKEAMLCFNRDGIKELKEQIDAKYTKQKPDMVFETYYKNAITRRLHELMEPLKTLSEQVSWYHKTPGEQGRYITSSCSFSPLRPLLQFEVVKNEDQLLQLNTLIHLNGQVYPLHCFKRQHFFLEKEQEYFLLTYTDYLTLEWLAQNPPEAYAAQPETFAAEILARLEASYPVNRNNLFAKNEITVQPVNRIVLSEIYPDYLVFTPQWLYEGFVVEGPWSPQAEVTRNGVSYLIQRDRETESGFIQLLESLHEKFPQQQKGYYFLSFAEAKKKQWFLKVYHRLLELDIQVAGMDMLQHFRYSSHKLVTTVSIQKEEEHTVTLQMKVSFGKEDISLTELQKLLQARQHILLLKEGTLGVLDDEWLQQYATILRHGKINKSTIQVSRWLAFSEQERPAERQVLKPILQQSWWEKWQRWQQEDTVVLPVPGTVKASLRPYQQKGFEWMALLAEAGAGACLADDMGLGKTLQSICFLAHRTQLEPESRHLIICPSSLMYNWQQELKKFAPHLKTLLYYGSNRNQAVLARNNYQVAITTYGTVRADIEYMSTVPFNVIVLDESHHIKNPAAQITRAVNRLQATSAVALSGTPVMNNTFDLYAQLNFLLPGVFGNREFFKREYADAIDRERDAYKIKELQKLTAPFILRRTKQQVAADLPPKTEMIMWCEMGAAQKALYDEIKTGIRSSVFLNIQNEGLGKSTIALLQGMLKLRQLCNSPLLLSPAEQTCTDSIKTELLMDELCNNLKDHKVLVFSQFSSMLSLLADACKKENIAYYHFDGQTPPAKRAEMANAFQEEDNKVNVFLISLKAGNAGLNLTAADYVFLFDPWWNTAVQQQAIDRAHRIGQKKNVFAYKMICRDTIEEKIIQLQQQKQQLAAELVTEEESFVKSLTEEDIAYLFS